MEAIATVFSGTPLRWCIVGSALLAVAAQAWLFLEALRRRVSQRKLRLAAEAAEWRAVAAAPVPRPYPEIVALLALLLVPLATLASVAHARGLAAGGPELDGWKGQLSSVSLGIVLEELAGGLGVVAWSLAFASRRQIAALVHGAKIASVDRGGAEAWARFPYPETETVFVCAGSVAALVLLPALHGALSYCLLVTRKLGALAGTDTGQRLEQLGGALVEARRALHAGTSASQVGLALAAVTCGIVLWWKSPARARRRWLGRPEGDGGEGGTTARFASWSDAVWGAVAFLLVSMTLHLVSLPRQVEDEMGARLSPAAMQRCSPRHEPCRISALRRAAP